MSATRPQGLSQTLSKGPTTTSSPPKPSEHDDEDNFDDGGRAAEEIGKTFVYRNVLTAEEDRALQRSRRDHDDDEEEQHPLSIKQRNATYGDIRLPMRSCQLGADSEALCMASSSSGNALAVGGRHGTVQLFRPDTLEPMDTIKLADIIDISSGTTTTSVTTRAKAAAATGGRDGGSGSTVGGGAAAGGLFGGAGEGVVTSLCFRPDKPNSRLQNVLLAAQGEAVVHLHVGTRRTLHVNREAGNRINALAIRPDGEVFASAGSDFVVRAYDEVTCSLVRTLDHGDGVTTTGHTNHVFSLAWQPDDPQILLSGGWDNRVLVWDLRVHRSVRSIFGPHICGDALDVQPSSGAGAAGGFAGPLVLTGSWRHSNPLQLWDLGSGRLLTNLPWWQPEQDACLPYAARFGTGPAAGTVVAGGSGSKPVVRVYRLNAPGNVDLQFTVRLTRPVHALTLLPPSGAAGAASGGGDSSGGTDGGVLAVCCDGEVHTVALGAAH